MRLRHVRHRNDEVTLPSSLSADENKQLVRRLVHEAVARRNADVLDELAAGEFARAAKAWVQPFQSAFPDFEMEIIDLIAEGDRVAAHFRCSGTHRGEWLGVPATGAPIRARRRDLHLHGPRRQAGLGGRSRGQPHAHAPARHRARDRSDDIALTSTSFELRQFARSVAIRRGVRITSIVARKGRRGPGRKAQARFLLAQGLQKPGATSTSLPLRTTAGSAKSRIETRRGFRICGKRPCSPWSDVSRADRLGRQPVTIQHVR